LLYKKGIAMAKISGQLDRTTLRFSQEQVRLARTRTEKIVGPLWGELNVLLYGQAYPPLEEHWRIARQGLEEQYWVSDRGNLAVWRERPARIWERGGYPQAVIYFDGRKRPRAVHVLVAKQYCDWKLGDDVVRHLNSNRYDNHCNNLKPGTQSENIRDLREKQVGVIKVVHPPTEEEWKLSPEFCGTHISNMGKITIGWWTAFNTIGYFNKSGISNGKKKHINIAINLNGIVKTELLHRLIYEVFKGPIPKGLIVRHINDDPHDNRLINLAIGSHKDNATDRIRNGKQFFGEKHPNAKYSNQQRGLFINLKNSGTSTVNAALQAGIKIYTAYQILRRLKRGLYVPLQ
jgi:hypothetical protein